jgi:serine/threonine protein kinase
VAVHYPGIYIPGFKSFNFYEDFVTEEKLASGGFGDVFIGKIVNNDIFHNYNNDIRDCVVKISSKKMPDESFIQELSMYELFGQHKYFAKLVCFSEAPQAVVLKFYKYGTLKQFIFPSKTAKARVRFDYTLPLILSFCKKIAWAVNYMHQKGVIHNDIKLDNILLDGDEVEKLYPVLTDFGLVKVLDSADKIKGFETAEIKACTTVYAAPEVLLGFKNKLETRISNVKTDTYSVGVVFYELFSRQEMWINFRVDSVLEGNLPAMNFTKIKNLWKHFDEEILNIIINLIVVCLVFDPEFRETLENIHSELLKAEKLLQVSV